jgi:hypothetical protein
LKEEHKKTTKELKEQTAKSIVRIERAGEVLTNEASKIETATAELNTVPNLIQGQVTQAGSQMRDAIPEVKEDIKKSASRSMDEQVKKLDEPIEHIKKLSKVALKGDGVKRRGLWARVIALFSKNNNKG